MKQLLIFFLFPILFGAQESNITTDIEWNTNLNSALKKAEKQNKKVMIYFTGSDWCGPCKALKKDLFDSDEFKILAKNYELLYIDIPRNRNLVGEKQMKHNQELMAKFNKKGVFPNLVILNKKGKEIGAMSGYSMNGEIQYHTKFLKKYID